MSMTEKSYLEKLIYDINEENKFLIRPLAWLLPHVGFSYNKSRDSKFLDLIMKEIITTESRENVICFLADYESVAEGIFFTTKYLYVKSPKNADNKFTIEYTDIERMEYDNSSDEVVLTIYSKFGSLHRITHKMWSKKNIKNFLDVAIKQSQKQKDEIIEFPYHDTVATTGIIYGNVSNASTNYGMDKFDTPRGHGFAAERANHIIDKLSGKDANIIGDDNIKNGADRSVNGINIQTKYCSSGSKCIQECFQDGKFKYINADGSPMKIEVSSDKYDAAIQAMENRIRQGQVQGITDPSTAKDIVRKGNITYQQAKNIAKCGTIDSITFDAVNGTVIATTTLGISTVVSFATAIWNGETIDVAIKSAVYSGLKVGGITFITAILSSQLSRAGLNSLLVGSSETLIKVMGPKASALIANAFRSGTNIYGATAMNSAAKLLRGNMITGAITIVLLSSIDVANIFRGRISGRQLFKNVANTTASVAGGTGGWAVGAIIGAEIGSVVPILGNVVGGVIGGVLGALAGGSAANKVSDAVLSAFIEDDANEMVHIIEKMFSVLAEDFILNQKEAENAIDGLKEELNGSKLKDMFASSDRKQFAYNLLIPHIVKEAKKRQKIVLPKHEQMVYGLRSVLEDISDEAV